MEIEKIATTSVEQSISRTDYLSSFINDGDKEPSWDGFIYVYNTEGREKKNLKGRVAVQVKGKSVTGNTKRDKIKYPIDVEDLNNYSRDGGTIYFVVYMNEEEEETIYYTDLLPFKIMRLLQGKEKQKTISVEFIQFPKRQSEKCNVFFNFLCDKLKQTGNVQKNILSLNDINSIKEINSLSFSFTDLDHDRNNPFKYLFNHGVYLYAEPKGFDIKIPVDYFEKIEAAQASIQRSVSVKEKEFYTQYNVMHFSDRDELHLGKSSKLLFYKEGYSKLGYKLAGTLCERICDEEFIINVLEGENIKVNNIEIPVSPTGKEKNAFNIQELKDNLEYLQQIKEVLDELKVVEDLHIFNLSQKDERFIRALIKGIKHSKPIRFDESDDIPPIAKIHISNLVLMLTFKKLESGEYKINSLSKCRNWIAEIKDANGQRVESSVYTFLKKEDFCEVCNIDYEDMWTDIISITDTDLYLEQLNLLLLELLNAYDAEALQKDKLFKVALRIAELLKKKSSFPKEISILNYLQLIKRKNKLSNENIDELCKLIEIPGQDEFILIGAYLLMDNHRVAKIYFDKMAPEKQSQFREFPICKFGNTL